MILRIEDITVDQSINLREVDRVTVSQYSEAMERGDKFPAIGVVDDGEAKWLYAGFHRIQAAQEAGLEHFEAEVRDGTRRDAEALACAENAEHGRPRRNQEKRDAVKKMRHLYPDWSGNQIAKWVKVSNHLVAKVDATHTWNIPSMDQERTFIHHKTGQPTTMKTGNIGVKPEAELPDGYRGKVYHHGNLANGTVATCLVCHQSYDGTKIEYCPYCYHTPEQRSDYLEAQQQPDTGSPARTNDLVNQIETLPEVVEPKSDIVVEFAGKKVGTLGELLDIKLPEDVRREQFIDLNLAVIKSSKLLDGLIEGCQKNFELMEIPVSFEEKNAFPATCQKFWHWLYQDDMEHGFTNARRSRESIVQSLEELLVFYRALESERVFTREYYDE